MVVFVILRNPQSVRNKQKVNKCVLWETEQQDNKIILHLMDKKADRTEIVVFSHPTIQILAHLSNPEFYVEKSVGIDLVLHKQFFNCAVQCLWDVHNIPLSLTLWPPVPLATSLCCGSVLAGNSAFQREVESDTSWVVGQAALSQGFVIKKSCLLLTERV